MLPVHRHEIEIWPQNSERLRLDYHVILELIIVIKRWYDAVDKGLKLILERFPIDFAAAIDIIANTFISYAEDRTPGEQDKGSKWLRISTQGNID